MAAMYKEVPSALLNVDPESPTKEIPDDEEQTRHPTSFRLATVAAAILGLIVVACVAVNYSGMNNSPNLQPKSLGSAIIEENQVDVESYLKSELSDAQAKDDYSKVVKLQKALNELHKDASSQGNVQMNSGGQSCQGGSGCSNVIGGQTNNQNNKGVISGTTNGDISNTVEAKKCEGSGNSFQGGAAQVVCCYSPSGAGCCGEAAAVSAGKDSWPDWSSKLPKTSTGGQCPQGTQRKL